ncbi:MAG TPA: alkaline phosphatase family protein [Bacteroidia bacterium]|nr:alkaline phosphatase family protein [Bacteroidia bacterium]HRH08955.1 alkaline phosphatase family protein [Bacteroidia bacterium]HRH63861.1 alkaline phosphatase family protein [Bacteroidia bacterium]
MLRKKSSLLFLFLTCLTLSQSVAQTVEQPKLVIGIVVDQMRYDYIYRYWDNYSEYGFKRLVNEGYFCRNVNYTYVPTYTAPGHASIYTGTTPSMHGIIGNNWFDRTRNKTIYCTADYAYKTVGSTSSAGQMSPHNMLATTVGDELRLSNNKKSKVIGIALKDRGAILPAGHTANAAYWFDDLTGNFISSSFYLNELPAWVNAFNKENHVQKLLNNSWELLLSPDKYSQSNADVNKYEGMFKSETSPAFPHRLPLLMKDNGGLGLVRLTPFGNTLTKDFAIATLEAEQLGKKGTTDFLTISFSSTDYIGHQFGPGSMEMQDTYLRLDKDLADLLGFLDTYIGKKNVLLFLTADHAGVENPAQLGDLNIPSGYFDSEHPIDSLKSYLARSYGDTLVLSYSNEQIYLNQSYIRSKNLNLENIQTDVAGYMLKFRGIANTATASTMNTSEFKNGVKSFMQNGYNQKRSGDVLINYEPAWIEFSRTGTTHGSPYSYDTHVPLIFYGYTIPKGSNSEAISISDIAPTIAQLLNIQFPNACSGKPIIQLTK